MECVVLPQLIPRVELRQLDPTIVDRELAAKRKKILKRELMTMLTPIQVKTQVCFSAKSERIACIPSKNTGQINCGAVVLTFLSGSWVRATKAPSTVPPQPATTPKQPHHSISAKAHDLKPRIPPGWTGPIRIGWCEQDISMLFVNFYSH